MKARTISIGVVAALLAALLITVTGTASGAAEQTETFTVGPFDLAARGEAGDQVNRVLEEVPRPDGDLAVRSISFSLVDSDGTPIADHDAHLHHIVLVDSARPDYLCSFPSGSRFAGTGKELTDLDLPDGYAYHSPPGRWEGVYHVMNLSDAPLTAAIEYTVTWTDGAADDFVDVEPYFLDVTGCWGDSEYDVPGDGGHGDIHEQRREYVIDRDGLAVVGGGHIHAGGIDVVLEHEGTEVCRAEAVYHDAGTGHHGGLATVTPCGRVDHPWSAGDSVTLTSRYHNHEPVSGAMGIMVVYVEHTGPPPPPPQLDIVVHGFDGDALTGEVRCNTAMEVWIDGQISQDKHPLPVTAWGYSDGSVACTTEPTPFTLSLYGGTGVLTGGQAQYRVYGWGTTARQSASTEAAGTVKVAGRIDLTGRSPEPFGPLTVEVEPKLSAESATLTGTVECPAGLDAYFDGQLRQRQGRYVLSAWVSGAVECAGGPTPFTADVYWGAGRMAGGPTVVDWYLWAWDPSTEHDLSSGGTTSVVIEGARPPSDTIIPVQHDPDSPLQILAARRTGDGRIEAEISYTACPVGSSLYTGITVTEDRTGRGQRLPPAQSWGWSDQEACDPTAVRTAITEHPVPGRTVVIQVYAEWYDPITGRWDYDMNAERVRVR